MTKYCPYCGEQKEDNFSYGAIKCISCEDKHKKQAAAWVKTSNVSARASKQYEVADFDGELRED